MKIPDTLMSAYFRLTTDINNETFEPLIEKDIREAHFLYAREIVKMYHGKDFVSSAEKRYREVASGKSPENLATYEINIKEINILTLLKEIGFASSISDARRLISGRGIKINGETITDMHLVISGKEKFVISKGKNKFVEVSFVSIL